MTITRWLIFHIASGQAFFTGAACLVFAAFLLGGQKNRAVGIARNLLVVIGGLLVFVSATPLQPWHYIVLAVATGFWLLLQAFCGRVPLCWVANARGVVVALWVATAVFELAFHHWAPKMPPMKQPTLGIIADSVTAGTDDPKVLTWPNILADQYQVKIEDHSQAGAGVVSGLSQAESLNPDVSLVLLEIGGNDILGGTDLEDFENGLANLLTTVCKPERVVVMLELPLPPTYNDYGRIQRRLADRFDVLLVPKRILLSILQQQNASLDSIHLTQTGQNEMAVAMWDVLHDAF